MSRIFLVLILAFTIVSCRRPPGHPPPPPDGHHGNDKPHLPQTRPHRPDLNPPPTGGEPFHHDDDDWGFHDDDERSDGHDDDDKEKSHHKTMNILSIAAMVLSGVAIFTAIGCFVYTKKYKAKLTKTEPHVKKVNVDSWTDVEDIRNIKKRPLPDIPYRTSTPPAPDRVGIASPPPAYDMTVLDIPALTSLYTDVKPSVPPTYSKYDDVLRVSFP